MFGAFCSFTRYRDLITHSSRFRVVLVILEVLGLFLSFYRFWGYFGQLYGSRGFFWTFCGFEGILVIFGGILAILVISRVFLSKFPTLIIKKKFTCENYKNIKILLNTPKPLKWSKYPRNLWKWLKCSTNVQNLPKT